MQTPRSLAPRPIRRDCLGCYPLVKGWERGSLKLKHYLFLIANKRLMLIHISRVDVVAVVDAMVHAISTLLRLLCFHQPKRHQYFTSRKYSPYILAILGRVHTLNYYLLTLPYSQWNWLSYLLSPRIGSRWMNPIVEATISGQTSSLFANVLTRPFRIHLPKTRRFLQHGKNS